MKKYQELATLLLRVALAAGFLSAVASRLSLLGTYSSGWDNFLIYTEQLNPFLPKQVIPAVAVICTILETALGFLLLAGYKTAFAAYSAAVLTLLFALAMSFSSGVKEALDYSVPSFSAAAFLLATMPYYRWSLDQLLTNKSKGNEQFDYKHLPG